MLNAVQQRMVEESLVAKEVHDAMMTMRRQLNDLSGIDSPKPEEIDLPAMQTASGATPPKPKPRPQPRRSTDHLPADVLATADLQQVKGTRSDPSKPIQPFIPPTLPKEGGNPFPGLATPLG